MHSQTNVTDDQDELLRLLSNPRAYPDGGTSIEMRETHISWVFLLDRYVYKLKKPVKYDFLDFSTVERRKTMCEAEFHLNRRFAPTVYVDVVPVVRNSLGELAIGTRCADLQSKTNNGSVQNGNDSSHQVVVDWLVKMRRLADDRRFESLLCHERSDSLRCKKIDSVATHLATLYAGLAPATVRADEFRAGIEHRVCDNKRQLLRCAASNEERNRIELVNNSQIRFLHTHSDVIDTRVLDGRIVDGHGDLRPDHIYLYDPPLVIDCVEFKEEYRTNDIADELSFLAVECDLLGDRMVGTRLFAAYADASGDAADKRLIEFYKSYRACVRAKVEALRGLQQPANQAGATYQRELDYLELASEYAGKLAPRLVLMVGGLMGCGKSTLAKHLGGTFAAEVISSDVVRQRSGPAQSTDRQLGFGEGKYSKLGRLENYAELLAEATRAFDRNNTVVLDASFSMHAARRMTAEFARTTKSQLVQVECECSPSEAMQRIQKRCSAGRSSSEARPELYERQAVAADAPLGDVPLVHIDTTMATSWQQEQVTDFIRKSNRC